MIGATDPLRCMKKTFRYEGNSFILEVQSAGQSYATSVEESNAKDLFLTVERFRFLDDERFEIKTSTGVYQGSYFFTEKDFYLHLEGENLHFQSVETDAALSDSDLHYRSPMPGKLIRLSVAEGDSVTEGQTLFVVEAMKMENQVKARRPGTVASIRCKEGDVVNPEDTLVELKD